MSTDPRQIIANAPMSVLQVIAVAITVGLNALDGFDVLSISFASPGIAEEWGINRAELGIVLSMELIGMSIGSLFLGGLADRIGRRNTILGCLVFMAVGMWMAAASSNVVQLSVWRVFTGLGIGGVLAAINAVVAEFSNAKNRNLNVSIMAMGYPFGAVTGGMVAASLLKGGEWRSVFHFGAIVTAAFIPLVWFLVPESVAWLATKQPAGALKKINAAMRRMGHAAIDALPTLGADASGKKEGSSNIFSPQMIRTTILVGMAYFFHITTFYYVLKWVPKIVVDMGFDAVAGANVVVWTNVGGLLGGGMVGLLTHKLNLRIVTSFVLVGSTIMILVFGRGYSDIATLSAVCAVAGFFMNGAINGLYAIFAQIFPAEMRASGTGFAIGIGRGGSVLSPIVAGFLFEAGNGLAVVSTAMAFGSLIGLACIWGLRMPKDRVLH
ncbi:MAG: MFS transporter [Nevskiaceae bacterium]|nr:MFS transporter [Nevskiaceae bacterium]